MPSIWHAIWQGVGLTAVLAILIIFFRLPLKIVGQGVAILIAGLLLIHHQTRIRSDDDLRRLIGKQVRLLALEGEVSSRPSMRAVGEETQEPNQTRFVLGVTRIRLGEVWRVASGKVLVQINAPCPPSFFKGVRVQIEGALGRPEGAGYPGGFDYRQYLGFQRIYYEMRRDSWDPHVKVLSGDEVAPLPHRFQSWARRALSIGQDPDDRAIRLVWAMVLGWRTWLTPEAKEPFMRSGTLHLFAISGLHIALIAGFLVVLAKAGRVPRRAAATLVIPTLWFYTLATGAPASAIRASTIASVVLLGRILHRPPEALNSIGLAALLLLSWQPLQLFQPGFQLSFTVVTSLLIFYPSLIEWGQRLLADEWLVPDASKSRLRRWVVRLFQRFWAALSVSLSAWIGSAPLIAYYFNLMTPFAIVANLILVPMASLTMASALMSLSTAAYLPSVSLLANSSAWFWMEGMIWFTEKFAAIPGSAIGVSPPSLFTCVVYYATLLILTLVSGLRAVLRVVLMGGLTLAGAWLWEVWKNNEVTTVTFLPIPRADAIVIDSPGEGSDLVIDGGPVWSAERYLIPFLESTFPRGGHLNSVLTHGDKQHVEVVPEVIKRSQANKVYLSPLRFRSTYYRQLVAGLESRGCELEYVSSGDLIGPWTVLYPDSASGASPADEAALVLLGRINGFTLLLLSDLSRKTQKELLNSDPGLEVDLLSLNLPADLEEPNPFVLRQLNPRVIIVTGSENGIGTRWVRLLRDSLARSETAFLFTGADGTIVVESGDHQLEIKTMRSSKQLKLSPRPQRSGLR